MAEYSFLQGTDDPSNGSSYTFSSQNLGTADAGRYIVVCCQARGNVSGLSLSSLTVGGVTATIIGDEGDLTNRCAMAIAAVPTGTTGDIVVNWAVNALRCSIQAYRLVGIDSPTPSDSGTSTAVDPTFDLDIPAGGVAIAAIAAGGGGGTTSWTGLTEDYDSTIEGFLTVSSAHDEFASQQTGLTITGDATIDAQGGVFASWAPASGGPWVIAMGVASEYDYALPMTGGKQAPLSPAQEFDYANPLAGAKQAPLSVASEFDYANPMTHAGTTAPLNVASEFDHALPMGGAKAKALGVVSEWDYALPMTVSRVIGLGVAVEADVALPLVASKIAALSVAPEADWALSMIVVGGAQGPPGPYYIDAAQCFAPGPVAAQCYAPGPVAIQVDVP